MTEFVVAPPSISSVAVVGGGRFPVRRIFCVGRNYAEHAREMGGDPDREPPFFFSKPADAIVVDGADMPYPPLTSSLHFEIELVVAIGKGGVAIPVAAATEHVFGYAVGLDMTRRDLQAEAKKTGRPWDMAKAFDHSAPIGPIRRADEIGHPTRGAIVLRVDGTTRQSGDLSELIWSIPEIVAHLSTAVRLEPGDLIFTGTPAGVGAVSVGDKLEGSVAGVGEVTTTIRR
ncbi:FAA hydrolase family protein [Siculibacillus lacustris]|uniref:FAA hydrolase family protein n=1 Tax=Siculibacillus lacustris TaxID=1549641 RepID=A0A4Q9VJU9_9HYPH|nr:fumarylacetoacetate hydrolase family protein [Siculibacillus lacustris]TBW35372.1 FAA hydrolase family protein [Siculibacillus lacustris]